MRIISICPSNTELLHYLGLIDQLIAVDDFSDWPKSVQSLPRLGPDLSINMDKVEQLKPDLVLASLSVPGMERNVDELQKRRIPHIVLNPNSLDEIAEDLITVGKYTNRNKEASLVVAKYKQFINKYDQISSSISSSKPTLYWEWWPKPVFTPGSLNWLTPISKLAGASNLFEDVELASVQTDWDDVLQRNPNHICLAWVGVRADKVNPSLIEKRPGWTSLEAVNNNKIHILEEALYCRPSPRLLLGLKKLASIVHPDHFPMNDGLDPLL
jgi:iron complex transport system substrate-binding protein